MICKFVDTEGLDSLRLGDEKCVCFIKVDLDKYDLGWIQEWIMSLSEKMPNVQWCILPLEIKLEFVDKAKAVSYLDFLKEKINEAQITDCRTFLSIVFNWL